MNLSLSEFFKHIIFKNGVKGLKTLYEWNNRFNKRIIADLNRTKYLKSSYWIESTWRWERLGREERLKRCWWRIDTRGHGVHIENAKANLFAVGKWIRFARRRNRKTYYWKSKRHKISAGKLTRRYWGHFEIITSRWKRSGYKTNVVNGWTLARIIHWVLTVSIIDVAISNDEIDVAKRVTNGCLKKT